MEEIGEIRVLMGEKSDCDQLLKHTLQGSTGGRARHQVGTLRKNIFPRGLFLRRWVRGTPSIWLKGVGPIT